MVRTSIILLLSLLIVPVSVIWLDVPLSLQQKQVLNLLLKIYGCTALVLFITGEITKNVSQVDKLWSLMPIVYAWIMAYHANFTERVTLMAILVSIWGARLTFNFARRGGYSWIPWQGVEDYRWNVLRQQPGFQKPWAWRLFHLLFICTYQMGLILLFCLPMLVAYEGMNKPLQGFDYLLGLIIFVLVIIEFIADQQQYNFQTEKYKRINNKLDLGDYETGFVHTGLWKMVRHPNYAAEQSIWFAFYFFSVAATGRWLNWSITGALLLMLLFLGSSDFSEKISSQKYPAYKAYQQSTPRFWPWMRWFKKN